MLVQESERKAPINTDKKIKNPTAHSFAIEILAAWSFAVGASLEFGPWDLELTPHSGSR
jgi:hypothetical protein